MNPPGSSQSVLNRSLDVLRREGWKTLAAKVMARAKLERRNRRKFEGPQGPEFDAIYARLKAYMGSPEYQPQVAELIARVVGEFINPSLLAPYFRFWEGRGIHITPVHYYSPIPDTRTLGPELWEKPSELFGIDLDVPGQLKLLTEEFPKYRDEYLKFAAKPTSVPYEFHLNNGIFDGTDALALYCMVRHFKPRRIIEVGSGYSSRVSARAALLNGETNLTCIEPYPSEVLKRGFPGLGSLITEDVQRVGFDFFAQLKAGDFLFIDSAHVIRTGGDVQYLYLEVLPRIAPGVTVHIHDIFFPFNYPRTWLLDEVRFWNEQYLLQAFLAFNPEFEVLLSNSYLGTYHEDVLRDVFPNSPWHGGCSFWMRRRTTANTAERGVNQVASQARAAPISTRRVTVEAAVSTAAGSDYDKKVSSEINRYRGETNIHELPEIFHYWGTKHILPRCLEAGFNSPNDFFLKYLQKVCGKRPDGTYRIVSIGAGNCDLEAELAEKLLSDGLRNFTIECLEINSHMLDRGREIAASKNVSPLMTFVKADMNKWDPAGAYDVIMANQALHHCLELERLFSKIQQSLRPEGYFVTSDIIGRNGHMRWPEARKLVDHFWRELPEPYRYNRQLKRMERTFKDWDCSKEGFEGIRAQDILPLLVRSFHFELFIAFGNVIDPFVDRSFGHNFKADGVWDRDFIDRVQAADDEAIESGTVKPTHMIAAMTLEPPEETVHHKHLTPEFCIRRP